MKKVFLVILILVITATVANAASINGEFKGNPIVKVTANGKDLTVDKTPAIVYNGNTLVPIYMLKQLGAAVTWDQKTASVDVSLPKIEQTATNHLRVWAQVADYHARLSDLSGEYIRIIERINASGISADLSNDNNLAVANFEDIQIMIDEVEKYYTDTLDKHRKKARANYASMNYTTAKLDTIERNLDTLINDFLKILSAQIESYKDKSSTDKFNTYINLANAAYEKIDKTRTLINEERVYFQDGIVYSN